MNKHLYNHRTFIFYRQSNNYLPWCVLFQKFNKWVGVTQNLKTIKKKNTNDEKHANFSIEHCLWKQTGDFKNKLYSMLFDTAKC